MSSISTKFSKWKRLFLHFWNKNVFFEWAHFTWIVTWAKKKCRYFEVKGEPVRSLACSERQKMSRTSEKRQSGLYLIEFSIFQCNMWSLNIHNRTHSFSIIVWTHSLSVCVFVYMRENSYSVTQYLVLLLLSQLSLLTNEHSDFGIEFLNYLEFPYILESFRKFVQYFVCRSVSSLSSSPFLTCNSSIMKTKYIYYLLL